MIVCDVDRNGLCIPDSCWCNIFSWISYSHVHQRANSAEQLDRLNWEDQRRNRTEKLQHQLKELEKKRSNYVCCYFFTFFLVFTFLSTLGIILYATNFFRSKKHFTVLLVDWEYWLNYDNYKIFNYNYPGIAGVAMTMIIVVFPLLLILYKLCWDMRKQENEHKEICEGLQQMQQDQCNGTRGGIAYAQGGLISIAIDRINCLNVHCTCYITIRPLQVLLLFLIRISP